MNKFLIQIETSQRESLALIKKKNADYADNQNHFKNFDAIEAISDITSEEGIIIRMCDKLVRASNLLKREAKVKDESIKDTLLDLANYAYILLARIEARKEERNEEEDTERNRDHKTRNWTTGIKRV